MKLRLPTTLIIIFVLAAFYGGFWLFNHVNAWIGIAIIFLTLYITVKQLIKYLNKDKV